MERRISDEEFYGWVADMTAEMAKVSYTRCTELALALEMAAVIAKRAKSPHREAQRAA